MPIDARISLGIKPPQVQDPFTALSQVLTTQQAISGLRKEQQQQADQAAIRQVLQETGGNMKEALPRLRQIAPAAALEFESQIAEQQKHTFDAFKSQTDLEDKRLSLGLRYLQGVKDARSFAPARRVIAGLAPDVAELLGESYDPTRVQQVLDVGLSAKDLNDKRKEGLDLLTKGDALRAVGQVASTAQTPEEWDTIMEGFRGAGVPDAVLAPFGPFSPENVARAGQLAITPEQRATLAGQAEARAGQAEGRAQTAAHQGVLEEQGAARIGIARQRAAQAAAAQAGAGGTLPPRQETTVRGLGTAFRNESAVKRTTTMAEAVNFVQGLSSTTKNPADDQGLIYAFAKAMDPESVVREGEYATVQKYATSWLERFGFDARRVLSSDTPILTKAARDNLKATINSRYQASRKQYDNLVKSYTAQINKATGRTDGAERLTDYASAFPEALTDDEGATTSSPGRGGGAGLTYQDYLRSKGK